MAGSAPLRGPIIIGSNQRRAAEWRAPSKEYEADLEARGPPESALVQVPERHRDRLARFGRLPADRLAELMELAAQRVHLIDEVDHRLDRVVIEAHLVDQFGEQTGARHIDGLEDPGVALGARPQQAAFPPALDMNGGEPAVRAQQVIEARHVNCSIALRGSWARPASHFSRNSFNAASGCSGSTTLSLTY